MLENRNLLCEMEELELNYDMQQFVPCEGLKRQWRPIPFVCH